MHLVSVAALMRQQAEACGGLGSPLYAAVLEQVAQDVAAQGPCARAVAGYEQAAESDALPLRLLAGVHALALTGRAPDLAAHYPSTGGTFDPGRPAACWSAFRAAVAAETAWVRDWLTRPPQTNEVGRANLLIAGLLKAAVTVPLPIRLFELGASAGLNLRADRFRCTSKSFTWGPQDASVVLTDAWHGDPPEWLTAAAAEHPSLTIAERRGCDLTPIDPLSPSGALALRAYVWPDQTDRVARLDGALRLAGRLPAEVTALGAADFLSGVTLQPGTLTVVWHSVMRQYVPAAEWQQVERELDRLAAASTARAGFAHVFFEPVGDRPRFRLTVRLGTAPETALAEAHPHGLPARSIDTGSIGGPVTVQG